MAQAFSVPLKKKKGGSKGIQEESKEENPKDLKKRFLALKRHLSEGVVEGRNTSTKKSQKYWDGKDIGRHAVCIKYDQNGKAWLYDPGKKVPKCLAVENLADENRVREVLTDYCNSLLETYQVYRFSMECNN